MADKPRAWSDRRLIPRRGRFNLHPDGERVVVAPAAQNDAETKQDKLVFVLNFFDELCRLAPPTKN